ncbi:MAG: thioredoxin family protein [Saprospiraceae bacterium]|nr:thioredoxin family protein [Saprospiraceae bacterium]
MDIKIYGVGGYADQVLTKSLNMAAADLGLQVDLEKVGDIELFVKLGIWAIPALTINDELISYGRVPSVSEIKQHLLREMNLKNSALSED